MNIKIDLVISASPELLNALTALVGAKPVATPIPENGEAKVVKTERIKAPRKSETVAPTPNYESGTTEKTGVEIAGENGAAEVKTDLTQEMIIADAVPKSKAGHKDKIKAKVTELGYESITDLKPEHFDEFFAFLQTIPKPA